MQTPVQIIRVATPDAPARPASLAADVEVQRIFARPGSSFSSVAAQWINWIVGTASRREL